MAERKLLLADDSLTIQKVVNLTFADEGIEVISVGDGDSAVQRAIEDMPDLVLADVNMPGLSGYQVCEQLRKDERTRHIPVILLIGAFEQFDEEEAARVGATAHLTKPFQSIRQLVNQVAELIEASEHSVSPLISSTPEAASIEMEQPAENTSTRNPFDEPVRTRSGSIREDSIESLDPQSESISDSLVELTEGASQDDDRIDEPDDIDRLYRQSIGKESVPVDGDFPDLGLDDEMIETSYSSPQSEDDALDMTHSSETDQFVEPIPEVAANHQAALRDTQQLNTYETADLNVADVPQQIEPTGPDRPDETVRLDPAIVDAKMAEANRRFEPIEQPPGPGTAPPVGEETIRMESRFDAQGSASYEFDDIDLLDIPSETEIEITAPADAAVRGGNKQIVTLSPDLIEVIAQRVVEKLSEKY